MTIPVADTPPAGFPPVVTDVTFSGVPDGPWSTGRVTGGALRLSQDTVGSVASTAAHPRTLRDVVLDGRMTLTAGGELDFAGWYLRQGTPERYLVCGFSPAGRVGMFEVDGASRRIIVQGDLQPDHPFNTGIGSPNRITVVAVGPSITFLLNAAVVAGVTTDQRFAEGHAGPVLIKGDPGPESAVRVDWLQVRAVLADQAVTR
jgi:hypothetical protein